MKRLNELTDPELVQIYSEGIIDDLIDLECAYRGIPLLPPCPTEPVKSTIEPTVKTFEVGGFTVKSQKDAATILEAINKVTLLKTDYLSGDYNRRYVEIMREDDYNYPEIKTKIYFEKDVLVANQSALRAYEQAKDTYNEQLNKYNEIFGFRKEIVDEISERMSVYNELLYRQERANDLMAKYLELADGNDEIARRFMKNAEPELYREFYMEDSCG